MLGGPPQSLHQNACAGARGQARAVMSMPTEQHGGGFQPVESMATGVTPEKIATVFVAGSSCNEATPSCTSTAISGHTLH